MTPLDGADPFLTLPSAERRRLIISTVLLIAVWIVATAAFLVTLDKVLGPTEDAIAKHSTSRVRG